MHTHANFAIAEVSLDVHHWMFQRKHLGQFLLRHKIVTIECTQGADPGGGPP